MAKVRLRRSDDDVDAQLSRLLQVGVLTAATIVALGGLVFLAKYGRSAPDLASFRGEPVGLRYVRGIVDAARSGSGRGLIQLGLLVLIATPVARVAFSLFTFVRQRDTTYVAITCIVLALLLLSMTGVV